jgi:uncharacterized protein (TIGR03790 family)
MTFKKLFSFSVTLALVLYGTVGGQTVEEVSGVVIVVNANDAESIEIGQYYAAQRGIPKENIIALRTSTSETVSVREYVDTISNPLLNTLIEKKWVEGVKSLGRDHTGRERLSVAVHSIRYLVTVRGVPVRIANDPQLLEPSTAGIPAQFRVNRGSVDGELALLVAPPKVSMTAFVPNPIFNKVTPSAAELSRLIRVSRLDGPTAQSVVKLIDRTLEAEATGLIGRAYFDIGGPHKKGDEWINAAGDLAKAAYFDTDFETTKRLMSLNNRFDAPAIYMGWYRQNAYGPWLEPRWSVPPGAIAFHLHSFSATTVRSKSSAWLGAFVNQGYCATVGNVYEPYLEYTHRPQLLLGYLLEGHSFGDAAMFSNPSLSWQGVAIGDPLYRPFKVDLDAQLEDSGGGPFSAYLILRQINRLKAESSRAEATSFARSSFLRQPSLALAYELAQLYAAEGKSKDAVEVLGIIRYITVFGMDEQILVKQIADFLYKQGETVLALDTYDKLIEQKGLGKTLRIALLRGGAPIAAAAGRVTKSSGWTLEAQRLSQPPVPKPKQSDG